jgi:hypothetical protein
MSTSKLQIKVGIVEFSGEGEETWLAKQLETIIAKIPELLRIENATSAMESAEKAAHLKHAPGSADKVGTLATWLKNKNATTNQNRKFLATSAYLQIKGKDRISSGDVRKALSDNSQSALSNPSEALNQNNGKGFCEKDGKSFYVTPEGFKELGIES